MSSVEGSLESKYHTQLSSGPRKKEAEKKNSEKVAGGMSFVCVMCRRLWKKILRSRAEEKKSIEEKSTSCIVHCVTYVLKVVE